jgi:hypothetical protein
MFATAAESVKRSHAARRCSFVSVADQPPQLAKQGARRHNPPSQFKIEGLSNFVQSPKRRHLCATRAMRALSVGPQN